jgi:hypothetical protein
MGLLFGNAVRFGVADRLAGDVMTAGEGIETMLSANHLTAILFQATLRRLYVAHDRDAADSSRWPP